MRALLIAGILGWASVVLAQPDDVIWSRTIRVNGAIAPRTVLCDSGNSIWISGVAGVEFLDLFMLKLDVSGDSLWFQTFDLSASGEDGGGFLCRTQSGDLMLAGCGPIGSGNSQIHLVRIESTGEIVWERTFGSHNSEEVEAMIESVNGDIVIAGSRGSTPMLFRVNSLGDSLWMHYYPTLSQGSFNDVRQISNGEFLIAGEVVVGENNTHLLVAKTDSLGNLLESTNYGGDRREMGHAISGLEENGFLFTGRSSSFSENIWDLYLVKQNAVGDTEWTQTIENGDYLSGEQAISLPNESHTTLSISGIDHEWGIELTNFRDSGDVQWRAVYPIGNEWFPYAAFNIDTCGAYVLAGTRWPNELVIYKATGGTQNIEDRIQYNIPNSFNFRVFPNPFNASTTISFDLDRPGMVRLKVFDITGREVSSLIEESMTAGTHDVLFDGAGLASGIYFYSLQAGEQKMTKKMVLIR